MPTTAAIVSSPVPSDPSVPEVTRRLRLILEAETRDPERTLEQVRRPYGVGRTLLYEARCRVRRALEPRRPGPDPVKQELARLRQRVDDVERDNRRLHDELEAAQALLRQSVVVTPERILRTTLALTPCPVSNRDIHDVLCEAFGALYAPADNTIGRWVNDYGGLAGRILGDCGVRRRIEHAAPDEIFFHQTPILCVVEPRSLAIVALERSEQRDGESWEIVLEDLPNLQRTTSDLGRGILAAARKRGIVVCADTFHGLREFRAPESKLERRAREALEQEEHLQARVRQPHRRGRKPTTALAQAKARTAACLEDWEHCLKARELFALATSPFDRQCRLATPRSQCVLLDEALQHLRAVKAPVRDVQHMVGYVARNAERFVAFTDRLWTMPVQLRAGAHPWWNRRRVIAAAGWPMGLCAALAKATDADEVRRLRDLLPRAYALRAEALKSCENFHQVEKELQEQLQNLERASSAVETINSKLRPLQAVKKHVSQPLLNLFALKHDLTPFERSEKRKGRSPFGILGVKLEGDDDGWLGVLMARARKEGLLAA